MLITQIYVSVLLLLFSIVYLFTTSSVLNFKTQLIKRFDILIMLTLMILYSIVNFIHYASFDKYQDTIKLNQINQSITLVLDSPTQLKSFYYSTSYLKGHYKINAFNKDGQSLHINDKDANLGYSPYFRWNAIDLSSESAISTLSFSLVDGLTNLSKVALVDRNNNVINDYQIFSNFNANADNLNSLKSELAPQNDDNYMTSTVFDEIYYATSAYQYMHNISPDVWVHPQLGILLTVFGMMIFGVSTFGFRIMVSVATIILLPIMYIFAKQMFKNTQIAIIAMVLFMVLFMNFVMGRFASLEPFVTLFLFLEYLFLYKYLDYRVSGINYKIASRNLLYAGICFSLAMSSKWNALYSSLAIILVVIYAEIIRNKPTVLETSKFFFNAMLQFVLIPLLIYTLIYIPYATINNFENLWQRVYQLQGWMLSFNTGLTNATHPYSSSFWSWPLDIKPLSVYYWQQLPLASSVAVIGNPLIFWSFFPVLGYFIYELIRNHKNHIALFLLISMLIQYLPYALMHRISFIYYFYSVTPLLVLSVCYVLNQLLVSSYKSLHVAAYFYVIIAVILFIMFYPLLSGVWFSRNYVVHFLLWMPTWNI